MKDFDRGRFEAAMARRVFLKGAGSLGAVALADLIGAGKLFGQTAGNGVALKSFGVVNKLDYAPTAKRVIRIHMIGAVSQVDTFDYKPMLIKMHGQVGDTPVYSRQGTASPCLVAYGSILLPYSGGPQALSRSTARAARG